jgi:Cytochrome c3
MMRVYRIQKRNHPSDDSKKRVPGRPVFLLLGVCLFMGLTAMMVAGTARSAGPAGDSLLAEKHKKSNVNCQSCHEESPPAKLVPTAACMKCHGDMEKLISKTSKLAPNPHVSPHEPPAETKCENCHRVHKKSENYCIKCHEEFVFRVP